MKIMIVGSGGREHALAWRAAHSPLVHQVYVAPGNAGTHSENNVQNVAITADQIDALAKFANDEMIDLTIVGPEAPLVAGIVDHFNTLNLAVFGPTAKAAQLEGSKAYCKAFLERYSIPTARYQVFTQQEQAHAYITEMGAPLVIKADGLAAGKGVVIAHEVQTAKEAVTDMLANNRFGEAGSRVVIEEFLTGQEISFICMADGNTLLPLATSQDHKARDDGDLGPNTGGMGAYSPAPLVDKVLHDKIMQTIMLPTMQGMQADGIPFSGFLYAGLMISADGTPRVLEYNVRLGDPETQPIMMRLQSDLVTLCAVAARGQLAGHDVQWSEQSAVGVVMAAGGYPGAYQSGDTISGLTPELPHTKVFHAGTSVAEDEAIHTSGGRVLCVTALGTDVQQAQHSAYQRLKTIKFKNAYWRGDIAHRAIG